MMVIGGTAKNVGKTELVCSLIKKNNYNNIIGLKITSIYPDEKSFHNHQNILKDKNFIILEELQTKGSKDTIRMKNAGAYKVFFICTKDDYLLEAINKFFNTIPNDSVIISESNSLRKIINPGLFIFINTKNPIHIKERTKDLIDLADLIIYSDGSSFSENLSNIVFTKKGWKLI